MRPDHHEPALPCADRTGLIVRAADGALDEAGLATLEAHLSNCDRCRAALEAQRLAHALLADWPQTAAAPDFSARVLAAIDRERGWLEAWDFRRWTWRVSPVAAALALTAYLTVAHSSAAVEATPVASAVEPPVSAALWSDEVSESDLLSLLLTASPDDPLAAAVEALEETPQ